MAIILVTGATGFLGRHIYRALLAGEHDIRPTCGRLVNLLDQDEAERLLQKTKPDYLIANAWMAVPKIFWDDPSNVLWARATQYLIYRFYEMGGQYCVFVSSTAATEHLDTPYGHHKRQVEIFLDTYDGHAIFRAGYLRGNGEASKAAQDIVEMINQRDFAPRRGGKFNYDGFESIGNDQG